MKNSTVAIALVLTAVSFSAWADPSDGPPPVQNGLVQHGTTGLTGSTTAYTHNGASALVVGGGLDERGLFNNSDFVGKGVIIDGKANVQLLGGGARGGDGSVTPLIGITGREDVNFGGALWSHGMRGVYPYLGGGLDLHGTYLKGFDQRFGADVTPMAAGLFATTGELTLLARVKGGMALGTDVGAGWFLGANAQVYYRQLFGVYAEIIERYAGSLDGSGGAPQIEGHAGGFVQMTPNVAMTLDSGVLTDRLCASEKGVYSAGLGVVVTLDPKQIAAHAAR